MMRNRRYGANSRLRSPSPSRRRLSPPSVRFRDRGCSPPRKGDGMDTDEGRHGAKYSRRDYNRLYERGDRDYGRSCCRGDRYFERNYERGSRDHERNSDRGDRSYDRSFNYKGPRISNFEGGDRDRYMNGEEDAGAGLPESMCRSDIYQSTSDVGYSGRVFKYEEGLLQGDSSSAKSQRDHLLYEAKKSDDFKGSINQGTSGSAMRNELDYSYQRNKYFYEGRAGFVLDNEAASMEAERGRDYSSSSYQMDLGVLPKSSSQVDAVGDFTSVPSHFSNTRLLHKDENFHFRDKPHLDKLVADGPFVGYQLAIEANPSRYSRIDIDFMASSSQSKAFDAVSHESFKEDTPGSLIPSDRVKFSSGMTTNYFGYDDYGAKSPMRSPMPHGGRLDDFKSFSRSYVDAAEERSSKLSYSEVGRCERSAMVTRPLAGKIEDVGEHYGHQDMLRVGMLDTNNDKHDGSSHQGYLRGNRLWEPPPTSLGQSTSNYYDAHVSYSKRENVHDQDFGSNRPLYERDFYHGHGSLITGELHHDYGVAGISWFPKKGADRLSPREYDSNLGNVDGRLQKVSLLDDMKFPRPFKKTTKRRHDTEIQASEHGVMFYNKGCAGESWRDDMDSNVLSKKLRVTNSKNGKNRKISRLMAYQQPSRSSPVPMPTYSGKPHTFGTRDIKKRLGPHPQKAHVSQLLARKFKPSLKKRLGPGSQKSHFTLPPWVKNRKAHKLQKTEDASDGSHLDQGEEPQEATVTPAKPEPPENSEEFRQMVFSAFFKFVKQLNETSAKRKKYKEQGKAGSLKCIVCGSSEEFGDTESLVTHAFTSQKDGVRSQHLGFHKALCALMGWKSAEAVNSVWICETLSHTENLRIKEDLILWPPVVIVHNSTIRNQNPDQRVIITLEKLEARLRDMGFGDKMKVLRGKPANQSIMVVQFGGTLSGLLEAERLHQMYFESKRGRAEFQQVSHNNGSNSGEAKDALINDAENILYGYLGTAEDLEKLDFDMKKRCVVKSKNDIQNIAGAPLKTQLRKMAIAV